MQVRWSPQAAEDLAAIVAHIRKDDPAAAHRTAREIYERQHHPWRPTLAIVARSVSPKSCRAKTSELRSDRQAGGLSYLLHLISPSTTVAIAPPSNVLPWNGEFLLRDAD